MPAIIKDEVIYCSRPGGVEIVDSLGGNSFGTPVDVSGYTSTNKYIFPSDGYISIFVIGNSASNAINGYIFGSNNTTTTPDIKFYVGNTSTNLAQSDTIFVRKGMQFGCIISGTSAKAVFTPCIGGRVGHSLEWTLLGSVNGNNALPIDISNYRELNVIVEYNNSLCFTSEIPVIAISDTLKYYNIGGYYSFLPGTGEAVSTQINVQISTNQIILSHANINNVKSADKCVTYVYAR